MVIMGRVPRVSFLGRFGPVPALGSSVFRFLDSPHIIVEILGCSM